MEQLLLLPLTETDKIRLELQEANEDIAKLRRSFFARHNGLEEEIQKLRDKVESMQKTISDLNRIIGTYREIEPKKGCQLFLI